MNAPRVVALLLALPLLLSSLQPTAFVHGAQILGLFSHPGQSHFDFFRPLFLGLAAAGHNVTMISYFPNEEPVANYTDLVLSGMPLIVANVDLKAVPDRDELVPFKVPTFFMLYEWGLQACEVAFNSEIIKRLLAESKTKYDVVILEQFNNDCMMAVAHLLGAPVIAMSSCALMPWHFQRMGSPSIPSFMPINFLPHTDEMGFVERVNNFVHFHTMNLMYDFYTQRATNEMIRRYLGSSVPPVEQLVKKTSLMLINQHFALTGAMPYAPNIVEVGGMQVQAEKPLPQDLKALLDGAPDGVVYISWGSMIRPETLPDAKRDAILQAVARFPDLVFLMKWANQTLPNKPKNLHTRTWLPQRDILCHPNVKAFMTHGGLLGTSEAAFCGVPMLLTPIYGDQFLNSALVQQRKMGLVVKYHALREDTIVETLRTILEPGFAKRVKHLSEAYRNRPEKPVDLAIWWVEHVIQTKGAPLAQSASAELNWFVRNSFDVYLFLAACALVLLLIVRSVWKMCLLMLSRNSPKSQKIKKQ